MKPPTGATFVEAEGYIDGKGKVGLVIDRTGSGDVTVAWEAWRAQGKLVAR